MAPKPPQRDDTDVVGARVLAQVVDLVLMVVVFFVFLFTFAFTGGFLSGLVGTPGDGLIDALAGLGMLIGGVAALAYSFVLEALWNGQTVGKRLAGIRVVTETGERLTGGKAFVRNVPAIASFGWLSYLVALLSMAATDRRQRLFDSLAGTVVVREDFTVDVEETDLPDPATGEVPREQSLD